MRISLLVPCYNAEKFVDTFLSNLSELTRPFDEVLFYDDASTDGTAELLIKKGQTVLKGAINLGPGYARNYLAEQATGDYIHFHDIDDLILPQYTARVAKVAKDTDADVILCNVDWCDESRREVLLKWRYSNADLQKAPLPYVIEHPIGGINGLYRRSVFLESGGFNTDMRIWEDADMHVKLAAMPDIRFHVLEEVLALSIRYPNSASTNQDVGWRNRLQLLQEYFETFKGKAVTSAIGRQAQIAAGRLIMCGDYGAAKQAFNLSEQCGVKVPQATNPLWTIAKILLPLSLRIQLRLLHLKNALNK